MGFPTKVQVIKRAKSSMQWYITFPASLAKGIELKKGEEVEWVMGENNSLILRRKE
jgi:antitoxin component of MazEF toxin-antitoxin module